jgi:hypothetical protein
MIGPDDGKGADLRGIDEVENVIELLWCAVQRRSHPQFFATDWALLLRWQ